MEKILKNEKLKELLSFVEKEIESDVYLKGYSIENELYIKNLRSMVCLLYKRNIHFLHQQFRQDCAIQQHFSYPVQWSSHPSAQILSPRLPEP